MEWLHVGWTDMYVEWAGWLMKWMMERIDWVIVEETDEGDGWRDGCVMGGVVAGVNGYINGWIIVI